MTEHKIEEQLIEIVKNTPVALRQQLKYYDKPKNEMRYLLGLVERMPWRKVGLGFMVDSGLLNEYGIGLSYCDQNMPETFIHEALHILHPYLEDEKLIDELAEKYHKYLPLKKAVQERLVYELGRKEI